MTPAAWSFVMISRDELLVQAEAFDLSEADVQRDYVFGWIISGIFRESEPGRPGDLEGRQRAAQGLPAGHAVLR